MFKTENMKFLNLYVYEKDRGKIVDVIIKSQMVHLEDSETVNKFLKDEKGIYHYKDNIDIGKIKSKIYDLINLLNIKPDWKIEANYDNADKSIDLDVDNELGKLENMIFEISQIKNQIKDNVNNMNKYEQMLKQITILKETGYTSAQKTKFEYLDMRLGKVDKQLYSKLEKEFEKMIIALFPIQADDENIFLYIITIKRNKFLLDDILNKYGFEDMQMGDELIDISDEVIDGIRKKIDFEIEAKDQLLNKIDDKKKDYNNYIKDLFLKLKVIELKAKVNKYFFKTSNIFIISGWLPDKIKKQFISMLKKIISSNYFLEIYSAEELKELDNVPVFFKTPKLLEPFESLTFNYGIPQYKTINPVPFVAITYLLMFGVMFGDIGHGLVLILLGVFLGKLKRFQSLKSILNLIIYCGASSIIFGVLFGSVFGYEDFYVLGYQFKALWLKPIDNISTLFGLAIGFGIVVITTGIIINIINSFITKDYVKGIFSKSGLIGGMMYWGLIIIVSKIFVMKENVSHLVYLVFIIIPIIILFLKEPFLKFFKKQKKFFKEGMGVYIMENLVELLEIAISYVSNTMSFIRVVAFGLAHAGLFIAIFSLLDILNRSGAHGIINILVLIFGNIGIILLEGLVVSIQAMRLEYYEFFGKFFDKTGVKYEPVKI